MRSGNLTGRARAGVFHWAPLAVALVLAWPVRAAQDVRAGDAAGAGPALIEVRSSAEAFRVRLREAAEAGDPDAQFNLGVLCEKGLGTRPDYAQAMRWYRAAADQGNGKAMFNVGTLYENARGVKRDYAEAARWYFKAGETFVHQGARDDATYTYNTLLQMAPDNPLRKRLQQEMQAAGWAAGDKLPKDWKGLTVEKVQ